VLRDLQEFKELLVPRELKDLKELQELREPREL
jgi:hypothetical protein